MSPSPVAAVPGTPVQGGGVTGGGGGGGADHHVPVRPAEEQHDCRELPPTAAIVSEQQQFAHDPSLDASVGHLSPGACIVALHTGLKRGGGA